VGTKTNRAAIGARIAVTVHGAGGATRTVYRTVNSGGSFGATRLQQHIGLGAGGAGSSDPANGRVDVEITWPVSKTTQKFSNVPRNQILRIREGEDRYTEVKRDAR
jgi:hypothetical protein